MNKIRTVTFNEKLEKMMQELIEEEGYPSYTNVIQEGIRTLHEKKFKDYKNYKKTEAVENGDTVIDEGKALCDELEGRISGNNCHYKTYSGTETYEQIIPLKELNEDMVKNQYYPSKEKVLLALSKFK